MQRAVLYCRSSKDRADISIDVQRRELTELARARGYVVAGEFADVVESGKDEDRPGLQALLAELYKKERTWTAVLALDTSRIARRAAAAYWFEDRECRPRGVSVVYKNLPDMDEAERAIVKAVFHGVDEWHSLVSKRKAIAGMRENVRKGHRAGGRAPTGYQLEHVATGAVRDGAPVMKSRLVPDPELGPALQAFLRDRAAGVPRFRARKMHCPQLTPTTLISIERNARVYAGHTVWNRHGERGLEGRKFRPETEWEIRRDTHAALITDAEASRILDSLKCRARARARPEKHDYLLAGLLATPDGRQWVGDRDGGSSFYRLRKARRVLSRRVDAAVVRCLAEDLAGGRLAEAILEHMRARLLVKVDPKEIARLRRRVDELDRKMCRLADLAAAADTPAPLLRSIGEHEREREAAAGELEALEREAATQQALQEVTEEDLRASLRGLAVDVTAGKEVPELRHQLLQLLERVELDPAGPDEVVLHYRLSTLTGLEVASPQRSDLKPGGIATRAKLAA